MHKVYGGQRFPVSEQGYIQCKGTHLHRVVWEIQNGPIPDGYHIHHIDGDKLNNKLENLQCLTAKAHKEIHMKLQCKKMHEWHATPEGRKFLSEQAKKRMAARPVVTKVCPQCNKEFTCVFALKAKYCGDNCMMAARRARKVDIVDRECLICKKTFQVNKYYKTQTCGYACGDRLRRKDFPPANVIA